MWFGAEFGYVFVVLEAVSAGGRGYTMVAMWR